MPRANNLDSSIIIVSAVVTLDGVDARILRLLGTIFKAKYNYRYTYVSKYSSLSELARSESPTHVGAHGDNDFGFAREPSTTTPSLAGPESLSYSIFFDIIDAVCCWPSTII